MMAAGAAPAWCAAVASMRQSRAAQRVPFWGVGRRMLDSHSQTGRGRPLSITGNGMHMLHKVLFDTVGNQAAKLLMSDGTRPTAEVERQLKAMLQSALAKLDVVSREEFDTQQTVLLRTRERLEALEKRVAELEQQP